MDSDKLKELRTLDNATRIQLLKQKLTDTLSEMKATELHLKSLKSKKWKLIVKIGKLTPNSEKDVHTEHCCSIHGCQYGLSYLKPNQDCPVKNGTKNQSFPCEFCGDIEG